MSEPSRWVIARRYEVQRELGRGGMGRVFAVLDLVENRQPRALKLLRADKLADKPRLLESLRGEFAALAHLRHPNLCRVYEFGVDSDGRAFFTMELVEGGDLFETGGRLAPDRIYEIAVGVLRALDYIHTRGYIHHDLKPENIMLRRGVEGAGGVVLTDFGLADREEDEGPELRRTAPGTVNCLAPEILSGAAYDHRVDLYALGVSLYYAATGVYPFDAADGREIIRRHLTEPPRPPTELAPALPEPLEHLILRLLAKRPDRRFRDANTVIRAINAWAGRSFEYQTPSTAESFLLAPRIVGHEALFEEVLREVTEPLGGLVVIQGEAGSGKSRLLRELRYRCQLAGADVWYITLGATSDPLGELIRRIAHSTAVEPELRRETGPVLARSWPPLAGLWGVEPTPALGPDGEAERLLRTTAGLLDGLGRAVVFDGDTEGALETARRLGQLCQRVPVIVSSEEENPPGRVYHLAPLDGAQVAELIEYMLGEAPPRGLADFVHRTAGGNPLFIAETLRQLLDSGELRRRHGSWEVDLLGAEAAGVPREIRGLTLRRLRTLSPAARTTAEMLALAAWKPTLEELGALVDDPGQLAGSLRELGSKGMLQMRPGNRPTLVTTSLARTLRDNCDRATALHDRLADFLESEGRLYAPHGYHRLHGSDRAKAVRGGLEYVNRLVELGGFTEARAALSHLRTVARGADLARVELLASKVHRRLGETGRAAAAAFHALEGSRGPERGEAYLELGRATAHQGRYEQALGYFDAALSCSDDPLFTLGTGAERVKVLLELGRFEEALELGGALVNRAGSLEYPESWFVREVNARTLFLAGRLAEAEHAYRALYRQALDAGDFPGLWSAGRGRGLTQLSLDRKRRGLALLRNSCWLALQRADAMSTVLAVVPLAVGYLVNLRPRRATAVLKLGRDVIERRPLPPLQVELYTGLANVYRYRGDLGRAAHYAGRALELAEGTESARLRWSALYTRGMVQLELGDRGAVEGTLGRLEGAPEHLGALLRGRLAWERGDCGTARSELLKALGGSPLPVALGEWDTARGYLARVEMEAGNLGPAEELLEPVDEGVPADLGQLEGRLALVEFYLLQNETDYAVQLLRGAVRASGRGGLVDHLRRGLHLGARLAERQGDGDSRSRLLKEARRLLRWMVHRLPRGARDGFLARREPAALREEVP
jgi:tetratricopeptide (TPR) repeat protein